MDIAMHLFRGPIEEQGGAACPRIEIWARGAFFKSRNATIHAPIIGGQGLLRMGGMGPEVQQSFSLGWVVVRSKKNTS